MERVGIRSRAALVAGTMVKFREGGKNKRKRKWGERTVKTKNYKSRQLKHKPTQENRGLSQNEEPTQPNFSY